MDLDEIITDLSIGELQQHGWFMGTLDVNNKRKLIACINIGLTELYTRFPLLTRELTLIQIEGKTIYPLRVENTLSNGELPSYDKYIDYAINYPFTGDLIRVLQVYDEEGNEVRLNDSTACRVVATPAMDVLEVPQPVDGDALFVIYQAKHPKVDESNINLYLPLHLKPLLLAYVAYRVYSGGTTQEHIMLANTMLQKFELLCTQQITLGTENSNDSDRNIKPCMGGWI
ncbi:hypothetical protein 12VC501_gene0070 [Vibrio phage 12VC501]|nr:hypothetical protein 12VC501_gene0070 [Vibrio phage 12VC501]